MTMDERLAGDPRQRDAEFLTPKERLWVECQASEQVRKWTESILSRGYHVSYFDLLAEALQQEVYRMRKEVKRIAAQR